MKYLGVDFGLKRVGLATSEGSLASPFKTIEVRNFKDALSQVEEIVKKEKFDKIVVGLPEGKMGQTILGFINALKKIGFDVETADETLSSQRALRQMIMSGVTKKARRSSDLVAATIILQDYLDSK